ncbi:DUF92 domain-containing protein [Dinghuibacter silviterrae]|uniref:Uncharacterized protein (TIGR00297 family) n=1 Tax=Dinghuibacter silviterrae TaxID=1539049 RepID=A0A4R8DVZ6_9BACT|nr:DUF92 domain-containing protein [Dinghuibacter silviterrae]TDX01577.1 uncharacterized protein (TIGR00297 family) [Dinghuibacter silviterrae]
MTQDIPAIVIVGAGVTAAIYWRKLTPGAGLTGGLVAMFIYTGAGYAGLALLATFFVLATLATAWRREEKHSPYSGVRHQEKRYSGQVFANGGVAALAGILMILLPAQRPRLFVAMAAALSSATADTLSSELGIVYGRKFINIITWGPDTAGMDGVISLEGLLTGLFGSCLVAIVYAMGSSWGPGVLAVVFAGTVGNLADSVLGATLERQGKLTNNMVNLLNTLIAAALGGVLG